MKPNTLERILSLGVPDANGCLRWPEGRSHSHNGYGQVNYGGKVWRLHRLIWTLTNGPIPAGVQVCHRCDVRDCYDATHLFLGTQADNIHDMWAKGRQAAAVGKYERTPETRERSSAATQRRWSDMSADERAELGHHMGNSRRGKQRGPYGGRVEYARGYKPVGSAA